ncbi:hypothetical protein [Bradyrhizobium cosmicum]|nr:hypothetical protein [Bradyrhizobium cosmicum]
MPVKIPAWWTATEIPLIENDWRNIKLYCRNSSLETPWDWKNAIYLVRLSPPFAIRYSDSLSSPLIYVGSGAIRQRWAYHRWWLERLGYYLPGARYEVWVSRHAQYKRIEADALFNFQNHAGRLPLMNRRMEEQNRGDPEDYQENYHVDLIDRDRRYFWAIEPIERDVLEYFDKGKFEERPPGLQ